MRFTETASPEPCEAGGGASASTVPISTRAVSLGVRPVLLALLTAAVACGLTACGGADPLEVDVARVVRSGEGGRPVRVPPAVSAAERLGLNSGHGGHGGHGQAPAASGGKPQYRGTVPPDWKQLEVRPGQMRDESYEVPPAEPSGKPAEVSVLVDRASPALDNVNRWRRQMGQPPLPIADLESLAIEAAGTKGYLVDATGTFTGMGGGAREGQRFLGLFVPASNHALSVRLLGDEATVSQQADAFRAYVQSLRLVPQAAGHGGMHGAGGTLPGGGAPRGGLTWTLPDGWVEERPKGGPRIMSFRVPGVPEPGLDIALMRFADTAGGLGPTLEMWAGNAGRPPLEKREIDALERFPLLGKEAVFVDLRGAKVLEAGKPPEPTMLLACLVYTDDGVIVARVWASEAHLEPQREKFLAFCKSWRLASEGGEAPK